MNRRIKYLLYFGVFNLSILLVELIYINFTKSLTPHEIEQKREVVKILGIPDLAISTEANYIRNRTLTDLFTIYRDDPSLMEYFPSTFVYSHSHILNKVNNANCNSIFFNGKS